MMDKLEEKPAEELAFTADELRHRAEGVLTRPGDRQTILVDEPPRRSDFDLNPDMDPVRDGFSDEKRPAAVLIPVVDRKPEATILLTQRTAHLRAHAGQISFPGGRMEEGDASPAHTALRETHEETGIEPHHVEVIGFLETYQTSTGFRVAPAVGIVSPDFELQPDTREVEEVFEVPLRFLMSAENHELHSRPWRGSRRYYYAMPYGDRYIWGATAGMLRNLYDWLYR
jgi:8-oxo-dGTP pyrophosphatase MutT (NUDIX family)